jgi:hypothetical protein
MFLAFSFPFHISVFVCPQYFTSPLEVIFLEPRPDGDATLICLSVRTEWSAPGCQNEQLQKVDAVQNVKCVHLNKRPGVSSSACSLLGRFVCGRDVIPDDVFGRVHVAFSKQAVDCVIVPDSIRV